MRDKSIGDFDDVCLLGNFNYPGIDWNGKWSSVRDNDFIECVPDAYIFQMARRPTRGRKSQQPNIFDHVKICTKTVAIIISSLSDILWIKLNILTRNI